jgi:hypothetical protein
LYRNLCLHSIGNESFQLADGHRLVKFIAITFCFAGVGADPAQYPWEGKILSDQ